MNLSEFAEFTNTIYCILFAVKSYAVFVVWSVTAKPLQWSVFIHTTNNSVVPDKQQTCCWNIPGHIIRYTYFISNNSATVTTQWSVRFVCIPFQYRPPVMADYCSSWTWNPHILLKLCNTLAASINQFKFMCWRLLCINF